MSRCEYVSSWRRHFFSNMTAAFLVGLFLASIVGYSLQEGMSSVADDVVEGAAVVDKELMVHLPASLPVRLRIPALSIDVPFTEPLGVTEDGSIEVPKTYEAVGWYRFGPTPGALGPAVVLGHVDSYEGPAVFFSLGQLDSGDAIYIDREDGSTAHFVVEKVERHPQANFPTLAVYSDITYAGLRLITCSGWYDRGNARYTHNLIVYARLLGT